MQMYRAAARTGTMDGCNYNTSAYVKSETMFVQRTHYPFQEESD